MRIITVKKLRVFWSEPKHAKAEPPLKRWIKAVQKAAWGSFAEVKRTFNSVDRFQSKTIFDVGGNKFRIIAVIDYEGQRIFIRGVLDHKEYDKGKWKNDPFGDDWKPYAEYKEQAKRKGDVDK